MSTGQLRASDADRDQVANLLDTAYTEGRLSAAEHSERTAATRQAKTFDELTAVTADLVPAPAAAPPSLPQPTTPWPTTPQPTTNAPATPSLDRVGAVLASTKRVGPWRVSSSTACFVLMGDALLDLTEATLDVRTIEITCNQVMGSTKIRVPVGTNVRLEVVNVLGDSSVRHLGEPDPELPTVIVKGVNVMGDVRVLGPKKPPPWRRHVP